MSAWIRCWRARVVVTSLVLALVALGGCGEESAREAKTASRVAPTPGAVVSSDAYDGTSATAVSPAFAATKTALPGAMGESATPRKAQGAPDVPKMIPRKIIYNARLTLVVESIEKLSGKLMQLVKESGGYVGTTDQSSYTQAQRTASWTIRIPVDGFDDFLSAVGKLGEVQQNHLDSQDVTQEYFDIEARISNKQKEETRLQRHLDESTGKLQDILAVEHELTRVRGEIETMQGRIRYLANLSTLSTVTITATEVQDYVPPVRPTFATQIGRTFERSSENLAEFGKTVVLVVVAIAPWVPVLLLAALPFVLAWRSIRRRRAVVLRPAGPRPT